MAEMAFKYRFIANEVQTHTHIQKRLSCLMSRDLTKLNMENAWGKFSQIEMLGLKY